jgi:hypothetical protein
MAEHRRNSTRKDAPMSDYLKYGIAGASRKTGTEAYRLVSESGLHFATVYDAETAAKDREFYADRFDCVVNVERVTLDRDPRW